MKQERKQMKAIQWKMEWEGSTSALHVPFHVGASNVRTMIIQPY